MTILSIGEWSTNAELIADVAKLGYIQSPVIDMTYGEGKFWTKCQPNTLLANDLHKPADFRMDWTKPLPEVMHGAWRTVVFDPPYKLNGTPTDTDRYGVHEKVTVKERMRRIWAGSENCAALVAPGGHYLVKVQNQVANGQMYWQVDDVTNIVVPLGFKKEAAFHLSTGTPRPQRSQKRARNNYSTLAVFRRNIR